MNPYRLLAITLALLPGPAFAEHTPQNELIGQAGYGDLEKVKKALAAGADINGVASGRTALQQAAEKGQTAVIRLLLEKGADPNVTTTYNAETPLVIAVENADAQALKLLVAKGARADQVDKRGETQLHLAARRGWRKAIAYLLDKGAEVDVTDKYDSTPLMAAARNGKSRDDYDTVKILLDRGADVKARSHTKSTALHETAGQPNADPRLFALLVSKGADVNSIECGESPLMRAAFHGADRNVKQLLALKADPNLENHLGRTALDIAGERDHQDVIALLKAAGAKKGSGVSKYDKLAARRQAAPDARPAAATAPPPPSEVDKPKYKVPENPDNFALVMGISRYPSLPEASFAERDAQAMRRHLVALGYPERNIIALVGPDASRAGLAKNLETKLARLANERSTVFFYYSGHGAPDPVTGEAYLVPYDGDPEFLKDTAYPLSQLQRKLGALKAKRVIVAIDACFSGVGGRSVLPKGTRPLVTKLKGGLSGSEKLVVISASADNQISGTADGSGHGLFTYYFLKGLNGEAARGGSVTVQGLYEYLKPKVMDEASRHNRDQVPQLSGAAAAATALR